MSQSTKNAEELRTVFLLIRKGKVAVFCLYKIIDFI